MIKYEFEFLKISNILSAFGEEEDLNQLKIARQFSIFQFQMKNVI